MINGDFGRVKSIDMQNREVTIHVNPEVIFHFGELDEVSLAYAISIHKSQGS